MDHRVNVGGRNRLVPSLAAGSDDADQAPLGIKQRAAGIAGQRPRVMVQPRQRRVRLFNEQRAGRIHPNRIPPDVEADDIKSALQIGLAQRQYRQRRQSRHRQRHQIAGIIGGEYLAF